MEFETVVARGDAGKPLRRIVVEMTNRLAYLANPERLDAVVAGTSDAVGFPLEDVFGYDPNILAELEEQWRGGGQTDPALWGKLTPYVELLASRG